MPTANPHNTPCPPEPSKLARQRPALFRALGSAQPPQTITVEGVDCSLVELYKHDSWAATALYSSPTGLVIAKFNRLQRIGFISMRWLGYLLAWHEATLLSRLQALNNIPRLLGPVFINGHRAPNAIARRFIAGHPLRARETLPSSFFDELQATLKQVHARRIAYMDLHKRENIIVGDDGRPYLIDFQVSYLMPTGWWTRLTPLPWLLKLLQKSDDYHCIKHIVRHSSLSPADARARMSAARPFWIKLHRCVAVPFRELRRRLLVLVGIRHGKGRVETEAFAEDALRQPSELHHAA